MRSPSVPTTIALSLGVAVSRGPRTSLIDADWETTESPTEVQRDSVPVESQVRRSRLDAASHGPLTSLIDAEWGTTECVQPAAQPQALLADSLPARPGQTARHQWLDETALVATRGKTWELLWGTCSIVVLGALGLGLSKISEDHISRWVTNDAPPAPVSVPVSMNNPPAVVRPHSAATVAAPDTAPPAIAAPDAILVPGETVSKLLVSSAKTSIKTVNRRPFVPRKPPPAARTRPQLPSVAAFDDL
ncbi:MAG TPA: hypothetical protein VIV60_12620 [Polyangiaceae bacterium]